MKYQEGQYNKTFLLTFNDGPEVVARLPNPNAGPNVLTTASEVATMDYARDIIGLPVPRVLSWNCDPSNPVGSEYIIMEKAKGTALGDIWYRLSKPSKHKFIEQVVEIEAILASVSFPKHGCIYYSKDLPNAYSRDSVSLDTDKLEGFCIGPVVDPVFWSDGRDKMDLYRGPWCDISDYAADIGNNERTWARQHAHPRMNYYRSNTDSEMPSEYVDLIEKYLLVAPHITACDSDSTDLLRPTLWHNDLHLNNIYVDLDTQTITSIIDWQTTEVAPLILQAKIPRMVQHTSPLPLGWVMPEKPDGYETLSEPDRVKADKLYESALCHKYYEVLTAKRNPRHYAAICHNDTWKTPVVEPIRSAAGAWSSREVFGLRASLMAVVDRWPEIQPAVDCPISFTEQERELHSEEMENRDYIETLMEEFRDAGILPVDGVVEPEDYEVLKETSDMQKKEFMSLAEDDEQRNFGARIQPQMDMKFVLVTGATGFIGAHIVDALLARGIRVRGATRSLAKGKAMMEARPQHANNLEFVQIEDFENPGGLIEAVKDVDGVIHTASPFTYDTTDNEKELIRPAINGVRAVLEAASTNPKVKRVVLTSSFASVLDVNRKAPPYFTYTGADWNPLTYEKSVDKATSAVVAYRGSKKFAELAAWEYVREKKPAFDLVALCPPMTFGPVVHPVSSVERLNESNAMLWKVASGSPLPVARVPFWIDVRDLAAAHVGALLTEGVGGRRYTPAAPERFSYAMAAEIIAEEFPGLKDGVQQDDQVIDESHGLDGETASRELGYTYRSFRETVRDLVAQALEMK
ncbi:phosphotransferase family protein [Aspergillus terreus]|uniref:Phosphotransferase family protein n=1 Tax=Aspergillus terreus TaxID=33178 RepID=A0A5M3YP11_ASPTE|nr:hypothetical protein ATETN484_0002032900 [Aspergillus terreus]GFF15185.1 phosphotransferase family protein [Aspergillus terreus]